MPSIRRLADTAALDRTITKAEAQSLVDKAKAEGKSPLQAEVPAGETGSVASVLLKVEP